MKKTLMEEFGLKEDKKINFVSDYDVFKDKVLLDELRRKIIEKIIDEKDLEFDNNKDRITYFVNSVIDEYDLKDCLLKYGFGKTNCLTRILIRFISEYIKITP